MKNRFGFVLTLMVIAFAGCSKQPVELTILVTAQGPAENIATAMVPLLEARGFSAVIGSKARPELIFDAISAGEAQLAIIEEPNIMFPGLTTITPLYPSVLHVLHRSDSDPKSFRELLEGKAVYAGPPGGAARRLLADLSLDFGLSQDSYELRDDPWTVDPDVYFVFGGLFDDTGVEQHRNYRLFSFGLPSQLGNGTVAEGIALSYPNIRTFVLPEAIYGALNEKPILTLSTRSVLVATAELDTEIGYELVQELVEHSQVLAADYPLVSRELNMTFDPTTLVHPLHAGARRFADREKPGFLERYVEVIALGITLLAALVSGLLALVRYGKQRKKDRVDVYYRKILDLRKLIRTDMTREALVSISTEVKDVQEEVFALLIDERVSADETLTIFLDLSNQVLKEVQPKLST